MEMVSPFRMTHKKHKSSIPTILMVKLNNAGKLKKAYMFTNIHTYVHAWQINNKKICMYVGA